MTSQITELRFQKQQGKGYLRNEKLGAAVYCVLRSAVTQESMHITALLWHCM